ncbi:KTSC domain-containing protein [Edaphocola aurantiacus]|uniref:KTSC domain-containing protein n=1 Tax=Edaphocola aurantiacus TaxID=2601682 RepID=UPI001C9815E0|nr:KTSC domain-containing protein [Edaphocola aurantiacus]
MPSTVVSSFHYDATRKSLVVVYLSGAVYEYMQVPQEVYERMQNAFSKGTFLNKYIKPHYRYRKICG